MQLVPAGGVRHGLAGRGTHPIFFTETLARHGYVVVAPGYRDAALSS